MDKDTYEKANKIVSEILNATMVLEKIKLVDGITPRYCHKKQIIKIEKDIKKLEQEFEEL